VKEERLQEGRRGGRLGGLMVDRMEDRMEDRSEDLKVARLEDLREGLKEVPLEQEVWWVLLFVAPQQDDFLRQEALQGTIQQQVRLVVQALRCPRTLRLACYPTALVLALHALFGLNFFLSAWWHPFHPHGAA
jgi:hypothetical protein